MRFGSLIATACLLGLAVAQPAKAGLIGAEVTYEYLNNNTGTIGTTVPEQTITSSTSIVDSANELTTTFTNTQLTVTNEFFGAFSGTSFNGPDYLFSGITIENVTIDPSSDAAMEGVLSFTAGNIEVSFAGVDGGADVPVGDKLVLDVTSVATSVPEPASIAILGTALAGLGLIRRRRKRV